MPLTQNVIRGWATTIIGIAAMVLTLVLIWQKVFDFVPEGIGGLIVGALLLLSPKSIEKKISEAIKAWGERGKDPYNNYTPPPGDV